MGVNKINVNENYLKECYENVGWRSHFSQFKFLLVIVSKIGVDVAGLIILGTKMTVVLARLVLVILAHRNKEGSQLPTPKKIWECINFS